MYRLILGITAALLIIFWGAYRISEPTAVDPLWGRLLAASVPLLLLATSYVSVFVRTYIRYLWRILLYCTVAWFTGLAALNHFNPAYGLGALFVVAATDAGFALGLRQLRPLYLFLAFTVVVPGGAVLLTPEAATNRLILICGLVSLAVIFFLILRWQVQARQRIEASRHQAEAASRLKSTIIGNVSHEFRTPLTSIIGFAEIIEAEGSETSCEFARSIQTSAWRLRRTLNNMVDLSRLEAGDAQLNEEPVVVGSVITGVVEDFASHAEEKGIALRVETPDAPIEARLSAAALRQVVSNLVDNAIKFTERGHVAVTAQAKDNWIEIAVDDTGVGMDKDMEATLFEAFRQESEGIRREHEGLGIGLRLVRQLIDLMGGRLQVESERGQGSRFAVQLPRAHPLTEPEDARSTVLSTPLL